jgi:aminopeptidase N
MGARAVAATVAGLLIVAGAAQAAPQPPTAARTDGDATGAAGIGDPYFPRYGNGGYDVRHYWIGVDYRAASGRLTGRTTLLAVAEQPLRRFNLDLQIRATSVRVNGLPARFRQRGRELVVRPSWPLARGLPFWVTVDYRGVPGRIRTGGDGGWTETDDGAVVAGAPQSATVWYPSNDHPRDKATFDLFLRTRTGLDVVSNGRLVSRHPGRHRTTWHWREDSPMATYLAFAAFGDFTFLRGRTRAGTPYLYAVSDHLGRHRGAAVRSMRRTGDVVDFFGRKFGPYPFSTIGGVVVDARLGFAIETQTRPVYERSFFRWGPNPGIVAHEVAHQWFGDDVSVDRWRDTWLNEGFATWASWLYAAHRGGRSANAQFVWTWRFYGQIPDTWRVPVADPGRDEVFPSAIYIRGALALQALRNKIGDRDFLRLLRTWVRQHGDATARVPQFERLAEQVSGLQLDRFFRVWLRTTHRPAVSERNGFPAALLGRPTGRPM